MNKTDLLQIGELIEGKLEPINKKLDGIVDQLADVSEDVSTIRDTVASHEKRISAVEDHLAVPTSE